MSRIFEARCVIVAMRMTVFVIVPVSMRIMLVRVAVIMSMLFRLRVLMSMRRMFAIVTVFVAMLVVMVVVPVRMIALMFMLMFFSHFLVLTFYCCLMSIACCLASLLRHFDHRVPLLFGALHDRQARIAHEIELGEFLVGFDLRQCHRLGQRFHRLDVDH